MKRKTQLFLAPVAMVALLSLAACGGADAGEDSGSGDDGGSSASGSVAVDGSSTVYPMANAAAELLSEENAAVQVSVSESGTGGGFETFCADKTDISTASRQIEQEEADICAEAGASSTPSSRWPRTP